MNIIQKIENLSILSRFAIFLILTLHIFLLNGGCSRERIERQRLRRFENIIETLRKDLKVPGMAAIILKDQRVVWSKGFGIADLEKGIEVTPQTPFHLASVTKPIGAVVFLQLVEQGFLGLNEPFSKYGANIGNARLIHLLTHTSDGIPGSEFRYSGNRYGYIGIAMKKASGKSFRTLTEHHILQPLKMENSAPNFVDSELLDRFFAYAEESGFPGSILDERGTAYELCALHDYMDPLYETTYALSSILVADALRYAQIDPDNFRIARMLPVDGGTRERFKNFWLSENRYLHVYRSIAKPYSLDSLGNVVPGKYSMFFNPAAGLISTVEDLSKFDIALDENRLISEESKQLAFTSTTTPSGEKLPYGIGWFVQEYDGIKIVWHGGEWDCISGLYLKVPDEDLTLIILANASAMSGGFSMGEGNVLNSGVGLEFLRLFVFEKRYGEDGPDIDWKASPGEIVAGIQELKHEGLRELYRMQLRNMETMFLRIGPIETFHKLVQHIHPMLFFEEGRVSRDTPALALIMDVENDEHRIADFELDEQTRIHIYCIGEGWEGKEFDYGWIEGSASGDTVWRMEIEKSGHAGGTVKNRIMDTSIVLPRGKYRVHYESDDSHSFEHWNAAPPDHLFWGIVVRKMNSGG